MLPEKGNSFADKKAPGMLYCNASSFLYVLMCKKNQSALN